MCIAVKPVYLYITYILKLQGRHILQIFQNEKKSYYLRSENNTQVIFIICFILVSGLKNEDGNISIPPDINEMVCFPSI